MEKQKIFIIILIIILVAGIAATGVYFFIEINSVKNQNTEPAIQKTEKEINEDREKAAALEYIENIKNTAEADIIGTITVLEQMNAKVKTDDGKEYILWPAQPKSIYEFMKIKLGTRVEVWGKLTDDGKIEVQFIQPL
jgi:DNA polymerase III delta prime subunit